MKLKTGRSLLKSKRLQKMVPAEVKAKAKDRVAV
jgi:hypothetical protein